MTVFYLKKIIYVISQTLSELKTYKMFNTRMNTLAQMLTCIYQFFSSPTTKRLKSVIFFKRESLLG